MLEYLFGTPVIERVLFYLLVNEKSYASQMHEAFNVPLYSIQRACARLEQGGILACRSEGKTRVYQFNPRYPDYKQRYYEPLKRARPRRQGKPLRSVNESD